MGCPVYLRPRSGPENKRWAAILLSVYWIQGNNFKISRQNKNNSLYIIIGITSLQGKVAYYQMATTVFYFNVYASYNLKDKKL